MHSASEVDGLTAGTTWLALAPGSVAAETASSIGLVVSAPVRTHVQFQLSSSGCGDTVTVCAPPTVTFRHQTLRWLLFVARSAVVATCVHVPAVPVGPDEQNVAAS